MQKQQKASKPGAEEVITLESIVHYMRTNEAAGLIYQRVPRVHDYRLLCKAQLSSLDSGQQPG